MSKYSDSKSAIETSIEILDVNSNNVIAIIYIDRITDEVVSLIGEEQRVQKLFLQNYYSTPQSIESKFLDFRSEIPVFSYAQNKNSTVHYRGTNKAKVVAVANEVLNSEGCVRIEKNGDIYVVKSCKK